MESKGFWKEAFKYSRFGCCQFCWKVEKKADWFDACPACRQTFESALHTKKEPNKSKGATARWAKQKTELKEREMEEDFKEAAVEEMGLAQDFLPEYDG